MSWLGSRRTGGVAALLAAALVASCSTGSDGAQGFIPAAQDRLDGAAHIFPYENLTGLLANTLYRAGDRPAAPVTVAVVTGRFLDLEPGRAFAVEGDAPDGTEVAFESAAAQWRTMHARLRVDEVISGDVPGMEITVGLVFWPKSTLDPIRQDLLDLGPVVVFLDRSAVFGYDPTVFGVVLDGGLVAPIDATGGLSLPALEPVEAERLLRGSTSVASLKAQARMPPTVIDLDATGTEKLRP
jgi:hypothetical protein